MEARGRRNVEWKWDAVLRLQLTGLRSVLPKIRLAVSELACVIVALRVCENGWTHLGAPKIRLVTQELRAMGEHASIATTADAAVMESAEPCALKQRPRLQ
jgi:hypothetical protein